MTDGIPPPQHTTSSEVCTYTMHLLHDAFLLAGPKCIGQHFKSNFNLWV